MPIFKHPNQNQGQLPGATPPAPTSSSPYFTGPPRQTELFNQIQNAKGGIGFFMGPAGATTATNLAVGAERGLPVGFDTLLQILQGQGKTDPALFNKQLAGIAQGTQANQTNQQGNLSRLGLSGSGVGQALNAAIGQSGVEQASTATAQENALQEQRKRQDLQLLYQLLLQPGLDAGAISAGIQPGAKGPSDLESGIAAGTSLIDAFMPG